MKEFILDTPSKDNINALGMFDMKRMERLKVSHFEEEKDHSYLLLSLCCAAVLLAKK